MIYFMNDYLTVKVSRTTPEELFHTGYQWYLTLMYPYY